MNIQADSVFRVVLKYSFGAAISIMASVGVFAALIVCAAFGIGLVGW